MQRIRKTISEFVVPAVKPDDTVAKVMETMRSRRSDCALIIEGGKLAGIFTERDFLYRVAANERDPRSTPVAEVMTREPETLHVSDSIAYAINCMAIRGIRNIPIVDDAGQAISVLDVRHIIGHMAKIFAELEESDDTDMDEWTDIGGG